MPVLSRFYGIVIRMYFQQAEHNPPHIHAIYGEDMAAIEIMTGSILEGHLPPKALSMVREWVALNRDDLLHMWETQNFKKLSPWNKGDDGMFHRIKAVNALPDYCLSVQFMEGVTKIYDVKPLFDKWEAFQKLKESPELFSCVEVDTGGYGVIWNDDLDLSCDELYANGETVSTPFDGLMAFTDATKLWGLNESTLRKAISYGKLVNGVDACKYGKQWVVSEEAMRREYGEPAWEKTD